MSQISPIEWTDRTWNFLRGCSRVSEGCRNCYAEKIAGRFSGFDKNGKALAYHGLATMTNGEARWTGNIQFDEKALLSIFSLKKPAKIFVNSMSDLFHEDVTDDQLDKAFAVMALNPEHTFQILTKRPERMRAYLSTDDIQSFDNANARAMREVFMILGRMRNGIDIWNRLREADNFEEMETDVWWFKTWPLPNVWLGVSVEDQKTADLRIPILKQTPAAVRWISYEPALGPIDWDKFLPIISCHSKDMPYETARAVIEMSRAALKAQDASLIDWIVMGGESGPGARPMHPDWVRDTRDHCVASGTKVFFKQWGKWSPRESVEDTRQDDGKKLKYFPEIDATFFNAGKKAAGRKIDGRTWDEYPLSDHRRSGN